MPLSTYGAAGETYGQGTYSGGDSPPVGGGLVRRSPRYGLTRVANALIWLVYG